MAVFHKAKHQTKLVQHSLSTELTYHQQLMVSRLPTAPILYGGGTTRLPSLKPRAEKEQVGRTANFACERMRQSNTRAHL